MLELDAVCAGRLHGRRGRSASLRQQLGQLPFVDLPSRRWQTVHQKHVSDHSSWSAESLFGVFAVTKIVRRNLKDRTRLFQTVLTATFNESGVLRDKQLSRQLDLKSDTS